MIASDSFPISLLLHLLPLGLIQHGSIMSLKMAKSCSISSIMFVRKLLKRVKYLTRNGCFLSTSFLSISSWKCPTFLMFSLRSLINLNGSASARADRRIKVIRQHEVNTRKENLKIIFITHL
uniref:Uncharacterized protein n=1 Tax=Cacopsylla melanoneura TaxID=428564 RepID=A0A8D8SEY4_9HEMI